MERKLISTSRVWETGGTPVVTLPKNIRRILGIDVGDAIIIDWGEVIKRNEMDEKGLEEIEENKEKIRKAKELNKVKILPQL